MSYKGSGSYRALQVFAVLNFIGAAILSIVIWANASQPSLDFDAFGNAAVNDEANPVLIVAGVLILGEGILVSMVAWALGTIGEHVVALRGRAESRLDLRPQMAQPPRLLVHRQQNPLEITVFRSQNSGQRARARWRSSFETPRGFPTMSQGCVRRVCHGSFGRMFNGRMRNEWLAGCRPED